MSEISGTGVSRPVVGQPVMREAEQRAAIALDYPNLSPDELLASYWGYVADPMSDVATALVNGFAETQALPVATGRLAELVSVAIGLRKAYGRSIKVATVRSDLGIDLPDGYNPTFALYLAAGRLRIDRAEDRKTDNAVRKAVRDRIRKIRRGA